MKKGKLVGAFMKKSQGIVYSIVLVYDQFLKCYVFYSIKMFSLRKISGPQVSKVNSSSIIVELYANVNKGKKQSEAFQILKKRGSFYFQSNLTCILPRHPVANLHRVTLDTVNDSHGINKYFKDEFILVAIYFDSIPTYFNSVC